MRRPWSIWRIRFYETAPGFRLMDGLVFIAAGFMMGVGICCQPPMPPSTQDLQDAAKCTAAQLKCVDDAKTLEESRACRAKVRAICNDGGVP